MAYHSLLYYGSFYSLAGWPCTTAIKLLTDDPVSLSLLTYRTSDNGCEGIGFTDTVVFNVTVTMTECTDAFRQLNGSKE